MIIKHQTVLKFADDNSVVEDLLGDAQIVVFEHPDRNEDEANKTFHSLTELLIAKLLWNELGSPGEVTVTIEPGNKLDEEIEINSVSYNAMPSKK